MYLEKIWPTNQEKYSCLVPEKMTDESCTQNVDEGIASGFLDVRCDRGNHQRFTSRYLGGVCSLREGRGLSRKRLGLMQLGLARTDELAEAVVSQTGRYLQAVDMLKTAPLTLDRLFEAHQLLEQHHSKAGQFRTVQNWVGGKSPDKAHIVPPPPEFVVDLMQDWLEYVNSKPQKDIEDIILISNQFILIHPFNDGNGRLNRALVDAFLSMSVAENAYISPFLFRVAHQHQGYLDTPNAIMEGQWEKVFDFWERALTWSTEMSGILNQLQGLASAKITRKLTLRSVSRDAMKLIEHLYVQPIITLDYLFEALGWSPLQSNAVTQELMDFGILNKHRLREPQNAIIYDCPDILDAWQKMDEVVFTSMDKETQYISANGW
ncbi:filamentation induced by cAMP protein fic [Alteromonadaceae bacterium M269]|nr:filamentation induced by cAMP protein fic [Alteromonadaceae bacterium M269]